MRKFSKCIGGYNSKKICIMFKKDFSDLQEKVTNPTWEDLEEELLKNQCLKEVKYIIEGNLTSGGKS